MKSTRASTQDRSPASWLTSSFLQVRDFRKSVSTLLTCRLDSYDVNVSPDKRTIFLHSEGNLITALKVGHSAFRKQIAAHAS